MESLFDVIPTLPEFIERGKAMFVEVNAIRRLSIYYIKQPQAPAFFCALGNVIVEL